MTEFVKHMWIPTFDVVKGPILQCPCGMRWLPSRREPKSSCKR